MKYYTDYPTEIQREEGELYEIILIAYDSDKYVCVKIVDTEEYIVANSERIYTDKNKTILSKEWLHNGFTDDK